MRWNHLSLAERRQIRFLKTLCKKEQGPATQPFVATVEFGFEPKTEHSLAHVRENPLGYTVSAYSDDAEALETNPCPVHSSSRCRPLPWHWAARPGR